MERYLATVTRHGSFDFLSTIIEIEKYDENKIDFLCKTLNLDVKKGEVQEIEKINALALFYHEFIHFLDVTTTIWGLEYIVRKKLLIDKFNLSKVEREKALNVFMLNVSEIEMHTKFIEIFNKQINLLTCSTKHHLHYDEDYGSIIMVDFYYNYDEKVCIVPVSMLSVLEANAYANEILLKIKCIEFLENDYTKIVEYKTMEREIMNFLNDSEFLEYNLIFILAKIHFKDLSLKELLLFIKALIDKVLNFTLMDMSLVSNYIKYTFIDSHKGGAIVKDMQRGMSRHVVVFKFLILMYTYLESNDSKYKCNNLQKLKNNPYDFIDCFISEVVNIPYFNQDTTRELELETLLSKLYSDKNYDKSLLDSIVHNMSILKFKNTIPNIKDFKLFDTYLSDGSIVKSPNRINLDVDLYYNENCELFGKIDTAFKSMNMRKFHIHPNYVTGI